MSFGWNGGKVYVVKYSIEHFVTKRVFCNSLVI